ncbi:MAG: efflux RND transporter permease subunit [Spirochaetales bacterium]|nr:efflux RND transporter permease subunit [Spirochaetales bacterium]
MKRQHLILGIVLLLIVIFFTWSPFYDSSSRDTVDTYAEQEGELLVPQRNVVIAVLDLKQAGLSFTNPDDVRLLLELQNGFIALEGLSRVESILNASQVISVNDDIIVRRAVPGEPEEITPTYLQNLSRELPSFPELSPYINGNQDTLLFYLYFGNKTPSRQINLALKQIQKEWHDRLPFEYTGRGPIIAETESLLTGDIVLFFPLLLIMVTAVFSFFRNLRSVLVSLFLILMAVLFSYGLIHFLGFSDSPLILLIPVFSLGLLSDYLIHYFYHHFFSPRYEGFPGVRKVLFFPLSLTALSTLTGFLSLSLINGSGHLQLSLIISLAVVMTWLGVFFWLDSSSYPVYERKLLPRFQSFQIRLFATLARHRIILFLLILLALVWGGIQLFHLTIEPYPIEQLPPSTTIKKADAKINREFYGTMPFFIEVDTGEGSSLLTKDTILTVDRIHRELAEGNVGYAFSLLTVLKRMNFYFMGDEESFLTTGEFDDFFPALIEQYLLYYSSSVDPLEYESLLDNSYRYFSIKGMIYYKSSRDLNSFFDNMERIESSLPEGWILTVNGMVKQLEEEQSNLRKNWVLSFIGGSLLIFLTVLFFYKKLSLAMISLIPGAISMIISFGIIGTAGLSIDTFSIIFVAIITGLVIDYSIHTLVALDKMGRVESLEKGFASIIGYSGVPIFLSFLTSLLSFSVLFFSSFKGARNLGFLLMISLILSFFFSLYLIPLIILPHRLKKEKSFNEKI